MRSGARLPVLPGPLRHQLHPLRPRGELVRHHQVHSILIERPNRLPRQRHNQTQRTRSAAAASPCGAPGARGVRSLAARLAEHEVVIRFELERDHERPRRPLSSNGACRQAAAHVAADTRQGKLSGCKTGTQGAAGWRRWRRRAASAAPSIFGTFCSETTSPDSAAPVEASRASSAPPQDMDSAQQCGASARTQAAVMLLRTVCLGLRLNLVLREGRPVMR